MMETDLNSHSFKPNGRAFKPIIRVMFSRFANGKAGRSFYLIIGITRSTI